MTAGAVVRPQRARVTIAAQAVSAVTVRILFLPPTVPGRADASMSPNLDDGALVRRQWWDHLHFSTSPQTP